MPGPQEPQREKALREAQAVAQVAGRAGARALWIVVRVVLLFIAVSALAYRFLVVPRLERYERAMHPQAAFATARNEAPAAEPENGKYKWHYELSDAQTRKLIEAWPKEVTRVYVLSPDETNMYDQLDASTHQQKVVEGKAAAKDFAQILWDNSIDAALVDETKAPRYRNRGVTLVMNAPEDGSLAQRPRDVDLLLALFRVADVPASCCQRDPGIPDGSVGVVMGPR